MRRALLLTSLLLLACGSGSKRKEGVAASLTTPVRAEVRVVGVEVPEPCSLEGIKRVFCLFEHNATFDGCGFLEVGPPTIGTGPEGTDPEALCSAVPAYARTVLPLDSVSPSTSVHLEADASGERLAVHPDGANWTIVYLRDGHIVGWIPLSVTSLDWSKVPDLRGAMPEMMNTAPQRPFDLLDALKERYGPEAEAEVLKDAVTRESSCFDEVFDQLEDQQKAQLRPVLEKALKTDPTPALVDRYMMLGGTPDTALLDAWVKDLESIGLDDFDALYDLESELRMIVEGHHPRAGELSCRIIGALTTDGLNDFEDVGLEPGLAGEPVAQVALAGIALSKTPCPWVQELINRSPCAPELRCAPDGRTWWEVTEGPLYDDEAEVDDPDGLGADDDPGEAPEDEEADEPLDDDAQLELAERLPVCTAAQTKAALARWKLFVDNGADGPLLLAAATAAGELPAPVLKRNARRTYRAVGPGARRASPEDEDLDDSEAPCARVLNALPAFACQVPPEATVVAAGNCQARFDDALKTVTLTPLAQPAKKAVPKVVPTVVPAAPTRPALPR